MVQLIIGRKIREASQAHQQTDSTSTTEETHDDSQQIRNNKPSKAHDLSEQQISTDSSSDHHARAPKSPISASSYPDSPPFDLSASELDNMIMAEDMLSQQEQNLSHMGLMMSNVSENENHMPLSSFTHQNCTCNAVTGPCFNHLEKIRTQFIAEMNPSLQLQQQHQYQQHQSHHGANSSITRTHTLPPSPSNYSHSTSSESSQRPIYLPNGSTRMEQPPQSPSVTSKSSEFSFTMRNRMPLPRDLSLAAQTDAPPEPLSNRARISTTSAAENTRRFGIVLEAMSTAGFHDFDAMALAYYTARFEVGSFPAMAQCASRSRRMKTMLQELQENSSQWPRWESRGLHESVSQATVSLCLEEIERLNKTQMPNRPLQSEPANFITAFESLIESRGQGNLNVLEELKMSGKVEAALDEKYTTYYYNL
ncbi:hypothetical protein LI328DRAFT_161154 [Trichoderma asperelloides]|nr:hypothetical protein LI328DRAFT_161154 [Trichoderma asperelloides]